MRAKSVYIISWLCGLVAAMFIGFAISYIYWSKHTDIFDESDDEQDLNDQESETTE